MKDEGRVVPEYNVRAVHTTPNQYSPSTKIVDVDVAGHTDISSWTLRGLELDYGYIGVGDWLDVLHVAIRQYTRQSVHVV